MKANNNSEENSEDELIDVDELKDILDSYRIKAEEYKDALTILKDDLELVQKGVKIHIAIDFYDLHKHCFPTLDYFRGKIKDENKLLHQELGRCALLYFLGSIYETPILLLPPYMVESLQFLKVFSQEMHEISAKNEEIYRSIEHQVSQELNDIKLNKKSKYQISRFMRQINKLAPDLAYFVGTGFNYGKDGLIELLSERVRPNTEAINNYINILDNIYNMRYDHILEAINYTRPDPDKLFNNKKDAKAVQYIEQFNKLLGESSMLILVSSADHFQRFKELFSFGQNIRLGQKNFKAIYCERELFSRKYSLLRNTEPFLAAMVEICNLMSKKNCDMSNYDLHSLDKNELVNIIDQDLREVAQILDKIYLVANNNSVGGNAEIDLLNNCIDYLKTIEQNKKIKVQSELLLMLKNYLPQYLERKRMINDIDQEMVSALEKLLTELKSDGLLTYIDQMMNDYEKNRMVININYRRIYKNLPKDGAIHALLKNAEQYEHTLNGDKKNELITLLKEEGLKVPSNFKIIKINNLSWAIVDINDSNRLHNIEYKGPNCYFTSINLDLLTQQLEIISNIFSDVSPNLIGSYYPTQMNVFRSKVKPILKDIKYGKKSELTNIYINIINEIDKKKLPNY